MYTTIMKFAPFIIIFRDIDNANELTYEPLTASKVDKSDLELFVGNTPPQGSASEVVLRTFLNAAMHQVGLAMAPGDAVLSVRISNKYSFMRLRSGIIIAA